MRYRGLIMLGISVLVFGCASGPQKSSALFSQLESFEAVGLAWTADAQAQHIRSYLQDKQMVTEQDKILYLLDLVDSSGQSFYRNGSTYPGKTASAWLKWKMHHKQYRADPILTAEDFIHRVCVRSNKTGELYLLKDSKGGWKNLEDILALELSALEAAIQKQFAQEMFKNQSILSDHRMPEAVLPSLLISGTPASQ